MSKLRCEIETEAMREEILECATAYAGTPNDVFFEHGQWFVTWGPATYSVIDAVGDPPRVVGGFSFEPLG